MNLDLASDLKTMTELKRDPRAILDQARQTGRPVVVTVNGKAGAVILDVDVYQRKLAALNLAPLLGEAEEDVRAGRTRPARNVLKDLRQHVQTVSRPRRSKR